MITFLEKNKSDVHRGKAWKKGLPEKIQDIKYCMVHTKNFLLFSWDSTITGHYAFLFAKSGNPKRVHPNSKENQ